MSNCAHCDRPASHLGMCKMHYSRWRRHGDATTVLGKGGRPGTAVPSTNWGANILVALYRRNKKLRELAKESGIGLSTFAYMVSGKRQTSVEKLKDVAQVLGYTLSQITLTEDEFDALD